MAEALDNDFEIFLIKIPGFYASKRNCFSREGYRNADTFIDWKFKHIKHWSDEVSKRRLSAGGCIWGNFFAKIFQGFHNGQTVLN